ncbi:MAG: hypothetical protein GWN55_05965, partial [Phycisphaerae bacterium]|nr:hypothetical protein [Phycisphaerae bacterium]NIV00861.1 hypothetical protein [Phycisphaerae bacterium]
NFNNIVYSTVVLQTSHQKPTPLDGDTQYYWRVTASNQCGVGVPSTVYTFTTMSDGGTPPPPPTPEFRVFVPLYMMDPN